MKLWLISQNVNGGYDTYDSAVVCAKTIEEARKIDPANGRDVTNGSSSWGWVRSPDDVSCKLIGFAKGEIEKGVICASFNAG